MSSTQSTITVMKVRKHTVTAPGSHSKFKPGQSNIFIKKEAVVVVVVVVYFMIHSFCNHFHFENSITLNVFYFFLSVIKLKSYLLTISKK